MQMTIHRALQTKDANILFNIFKFNNQHDMSMSAPTAMHAICINIRTEHQPII